MLLPVAGALAASTITYMFSGTATPTFGAGTVAMFGAVGDPSKVVAGAIRCNDLSEVAIVFYGNQQVDVHTPMSIFVNNASGYAEAQDWDLCERGCRLVAGERITPKVGDLALLHSRTARPCRQRSGAARPGRQS